MDDIRDVYQRPYNPLRPMVCIDETNKQLIKQTRLPCAPGQPAKVDYAYERMGVTNVFMIFEPLAGHRETLVTKTRTAVDFVHTLKYASDVMYPSADKSVIVTDNLNTHKPGALYEAFCAEEAHRLACRFEGIIRLSMGVGLIWRRLSWCYVSSGTWCYVCGFGEF
jgi:hypothetical protein